MDYSYTEKQEAVKATYFIRFGGNTLRVRASHAEIIAILRTLGALRRAA